MYGHEVIYLFVSSFAALFPVLNPVGNSLIINGIMNDLDDAERKKAIKRVFLNCLLIGIGSLAAGHIILLLFGLAIPVIQVGGGIIICKTGFEWLSDSAGDNMKVPKDEMNKINEKVLENKLFYPISFPLCMGPGSISVIFTLMASSTDKNNILSTGLNYTAIALSIVALLAILYILLLQGKRITGRLSYSGNMIINKLVAFITLCIGIQILVNGIARIFHLHIL